MVNSDNTDEGVRRQLLAPALRNSSRSVLLLVAAVMVIAALAVDAGRPLAGVVAGVVGVLGSIWRYLIGRRFADTAQLTARELDQAESQLEANAAMSGLLWAIGTVAIYPALSGTTATTYVSMIFGSITVAAFFMTLVGRSFLILAGLQLSILIFVSLAFESVRSLPLVALAVIFGITVFRASQELKAAAIRGMKNTARKPTRPMFFCSGPRKPLKQPMLPSRSSSQP